MTIENAIDRIQTMIDERVNATGKGKYEQLLQADGLRYALDIIKDETEVK